MITIRMITILLSKLATFSRLKFIKSIVQNFQVEDVIIFGHKIWLNILSIGANVTGTLTQFC